MLARPPALKSTQMAARKWVHTWHGRGVYTLTVSPHLILSCPHRYGASESDSLKGSTSPAVGKESSTWCWSFPFR